MRHIKMLAFAAVASMALMAVIGVGTAAAVTKICSTSGTGTSCGEGHGNEFTGTFHATLEAGTIFTFTSESANTHCTESTIHGSITASTPPTGFIDAMTFGGNCTDIFGDTCIYKTSASTTNHWALSGAATVGTNGTMTTEHLTSEFTCALFGTPTTCIYNAAKATVAVTGSDSTATVKFTSVPVTEQGANFACSTNTTWSGTYLITTPDNLNITP